MTEHITTYPGRSSPASFTQAELGWLPWLEPLAVEDLDDRHRAALQNEPFRIQSPYFRLLARDPEVLNSRTRTDQDIFYNTEGGLSRAERELSAVAASRLNGCIFCASVHARFAVAHSKRSDDIQKILDRGVTSDVGERWNAIIAASTALTATPIALGAEHVRRLREVGLDDLAISDVIHGASFFNWANRLMLSLGQPV
jgi:alkylhydroperoxidase domain protein